MKHQEDYKNQESLFLETAGQLQEKEVVSLIYHSIFDYPLTAAQLVRWEAGEKLSLRDSTNIVFKHKRGYFYLNNKEGQVLKRLMKERASNKKLKLAETASNILGLIPTVKFVGVTGALAMKNASEDADIDLLIITKKDTLWFTRALALKFLQLFGLPIRRYGQKEQRDKLCLNIWLDETKLSWDKKRRNAYTAHEIAQITPLVDKDNTFYKLISQNSWVRDYWPNAINRKKSSVVNSQDGVLAKFAAKVGGFFEPIARKMQWKYMEGKITREVVTKRKALFHPHDWSTTVLSGLKKYIELS